MMYRNPITKKSHRKWSILHREIGKKIPAAVTGNYDEIIRFGEGGGKDSRYNEETGEWVQFEKTGCSDGAILALFTQALEEEYIDLDSKGRGSCLNHDLYAYDPAQGVAIIQARQYYKRAARHYGATRKTYFLCGQNEITGEFFRHPVSSHAVRAACKKSTDKTRADVVHAAQRWMWQVTEKQLEKSVRQGDVLLVPEREPKTAERRGMSLTVADSHRILADEIRLNGRCYALNPTMIHTKDQHAPVELLDGWYSIRVGREADAWDFAERIGD